MAPTPVLLPGKSMDGGAWWAAVHGVAMKLIPDGHLALPPDPQSEQGQRVRYNRTLQQSTERKKRGGNDAKSQARGDSLTSSQHSGAAELRGSEGTGLQRWNYPKYPIPGTRGSLTGGRSSQMQRQATPRCIMWTKAGHAKWGHACRGTQSITDRLGRTQP